MFIRAAVAIFACLCCANVSNDTVITLPLNRQPFPCAPPSIVLEQSFILTRAVGNAQANILLFPGNGRIGIADEEIGINGSRNFLIRTRHYYAAHGFNVAVMDAATDVLHSQCASVKYRTDPKQLHDIEVVVEYLASIPPGLPTWVIGTSEGTVSAAFCAAELTNAPLVPCGVVLTPAPYWKTKAVAMDKIVVPTLLTAHYDDACHPYTDMHDVALTLTNAPIVEEQLFYGGLPPLVQPCQALTPHGCFGIELEVVELVCAWISAHLWGFGSDGLRG